MMFFRSVLIGLAVFAGLCGTARGQGLSLVRDEEIERGLLFYVRPLFEKAGLNPDLAEVHLVRDDSVNAFAAKGLHLFVHTGLIEKADDGQEIVAVLAHETGHIAGGHIVRLYENMRIARRNMLVSMVLGAAAAVASGRGDAAMGVMLGSVSSAQGLFAGYRRTEENAADQTAVTLLKATGHDLSGFENIMKRLQKLESLQANDPAASQWASHPAVRERLKLIVSDRIKASDPVRIRRENAIFDRMKAKLNGFLASPARIRALYPEKDASVPARYARAVLSYRQGRFDEADAALKKLCDEEPDNPYFFEMKGQFLFERGKDAVSEYRKAVSLLPDSSLLRIGLAQALSGADSFDAAVETLTVLTPVSNEDPIVWRLRAQAYAKTGRQGDADYALAEYNLLTGDVKQAVFFAKKALSRLPDSSAAALRAQDVLIQTGAQDKKKD